MISTIYLVRLDVSRADNKKEEPQKFVCENCTNLENEPTEKGFDKSVEQDSGSKTEVRDSEHVPKLTPQQPLLTFGTAIPQNNNAPLPPPPIPTTQSPQVTLGTQPNPGVSAPPPPHKQNSGMDQGLMKTLNTRRHAKGDESDSSDDEHDSNTNSPVVDGTSCNGETASETTPHGSQNTDQSYEGYRTQLLRIIVFCLVRCFVS